MTVSNLITENKLEQAPSGLWHLPDTEIDENFAYSDGDEEESYVMQVIASAKDTSSTSAELESHIRDWPSEYHLTSKRANLLRALDLSGLEEVLELGCGCGAISRYLAEQGMNVDAVEGSPRRASIAHSRCQDLDNINIINSNFNHLRLPENSYDAVFLIGVLEYARRFCPQAIDDRAAVLEIIAAVQRSLKPDGVIITAIENRIGLKYLIGATEDHYGVPYIGIHRYPESAGIRTYDNAEWRSILAEADLNSNVFLAPFPDYKIPRVVLHEEFLKQPEASLHLRGSVSRDYLRALNSDFDEYLFWQTCNQNNSMLEFSNSYLIIAGRNSNTADRLAVYDFSHFTGSQRKPEFRTATRKRRNELIVVKQKLHEAQSEDSGQSWIRQICFDEKYLQGKLLADVWLQSLMIWQDQQRLLVLFKEYYEYLKNYASQHTDAKDIVDVLPFNIIVDESGNFHSFDREWLVDEKLTVEFVLFRALFWFVYGNNSQFATIFDSNGWNSVRDYIVHSFEQLGLDATDRLDEYAELEGRLQSAIGIGEQKGLIYGLLDSAPQKRSDDIMFHPVLYWAAPYQLLSEQNSTSTTAVLGSDRQLISFDITDHLVADSLIRFDPAGREGYFHLYRLKLVSSGSAAEDDKVLLELNSAQEIADNFTVKGASLCGAGENAVFIAHDQDPHFEYKLSIAATGLHLEVEMDWPHSEEYELVRDALRERHGEWYLEKIALQKQLDELNFIKQTHERNLQLKNEMAQLIEELQVDRAELHDIKRSLPYRIQRKLAAILSMQTRAS
jgi:SAM-dependent methyltransferase